MPRILATVDWQSGCITSGVGVDNVEYNVIVNFILICRVLFVGFGVLESQDLESGGLPHFCRDF